MSVIFNPSFGINNGSGTGLGKPPRGIVVLKPILAKLGWHIHNGLFGSPKQPSVIVDHTIKAQELNQ